MSNFKLGLFAYKIELLNKNVITKEANKFSSGCNEKLFQKFGWKPNTDFQNEF